MEQLDRATFFFFFAGRVQNSEGRNQWGGHRLRRVRRHDDLCRAVVEDHTALPLSAASGSVIKEALCRIRKGSDASRVLYQEMSARPLQLACKHDAVECARLLLVVEGGSQIMASPVEAGDQLTTTPLHVADLRVVDGRTLLRLDIAPTSMRVQSNWSMDNPIEHLLSFLHGMVADMNVIKILNAQVSEASSEANTTLHWCLSGGGSSTQEPRFVWLLLKNETRVLHWNKSGLTPVHRAVAKALESLLLHAQGCVDIHAETKGSPLFFIVKQDGSVDHVIELLLCTGLDTKAWNLRKQGTIDDVATSKDCSENVVPWKPSSPQKNNVTRNSSCVNIHFCDRKFRISPNEDKNVLDFVRSVLLDNNIRTNDFYLRMDGKILAGDITMNRIILLEEPVIYVCPRLRGGVHPLYEIMYERFDAILTNNIANLHRDVIIPQALKDTNGSADATFLSHLSHSMLHSLLAHVLSDGHLTRGVTWDGQFTANDVLISNDGHIMINPAIVPEQYTDQGGEQDYAAIYSIVLSFAKNQNNKTPVHFDHFTKMLQSSTADLRRNRLFVLFVVCHPTLLNYCEKYRLYGLVELLLHRLTPNENIDLDNWLQLNSGGHDQWPSLLAKGSEFEKTYLFRNKKGVPRYTHGLREGFRFGRNFEAHPPQGILNSLAEDSLDNTFFFLLTIVIEGLVQTLQPGQSADDLADILKKTDAAIVRNFWALAQQDQIV